MTDPFGKVKGEKNSPPYTLYYIGNNHLANLLDFVQILLERIGGYFIIK